MELINITPDLEKLDMKNKITSFFDEFLKGMDLKKKLVVMGVDILYHEMNVSNNYMNNTSLVEIRVIFYVPSFYEPEFFKSGPVTITHRDVAVYFKNETLTYLKDTFPGKNIVFIPQYTTEPSTIWDEEKYQTALHEYIATHGEKINTSTKKFL